MQIFKKNRSKFFTIMVLIMFGFFSLTIFAQEKRESKSQLDQLKGKVEKITVKVDGKDVVFEGKEAQKMADQLREKKNVKVVEFDEGNRGEGEEGNVVYFKSRKDDGQKSKVGDVTKKIKIEGDDGEKTITVTTTKDGKEETKVYKGDEAEKFLNDQKDSKEFTFRFRNDEDRSDGGMFFKRKMGRRMRMRDGCCSCDEGRGEAKMKWMKKSGKEMKMMMKEDDDEKESADKKVEKKIEIK